MKCPKCSELMPDEAIQCQLCGAVRASVYSRIVGYLTRVEDWHLGKKAEWKDRVTFKL